MQGLGFVGLVGFLGAGVGVGEHAGEAGCLGFVARSHRFETISRAHFVFIVGFFGSGQAAAGIVCRTVFVLEHAPV